MSPSCPNTLRRIQSFGRAAATFAAVVTVMLSNAAHANDAYRPSAGGYGRDTAGSYGDAYRPPQGGRSVNDTYQADPASRYEDGYQPDRYSSPGGPDAYRGGGSGVPEPSGYGEPYREPSALEADGGFPEPKSPQEAGVYERNEIVTAGHRFFGTVSQSLAKGIEWAFQSQGRPNGYILGEDAGGAFVLGLRYGEGVLHTKNAGTHKVFWQGPSVGYDAGAEGSKTMILVYNLRDPSQIYERFGGVQGAAYLVGGVSVQLQKHGEVTLAVIRSGVGLRLGANVGYMKYTRAPTWNPL